MKPLSMIFTVLSEFAFLDAFQMLVAIRFISVIKIIQFRLIVITPSLVQIGFILNISKRTLLRVFFVQSWWKACVFGVVVHNWVSFHSDLHVVTILSIMCMLLTTLFRIQIRTSVEFRRRINFLIFIQVSPSALQLNFETVISILFIGKHRIIFVRGHRAWIII